MAPLALKLASGDSLTIRALLSLLGNQVEVTTSAAEGNQSSLSHDKVQVTGAGEICKHLAKQAPSLRLLGDNDESAAMVEEWVRFAKERLAKSEMKRIKETFDLLQGRLRMRSYLVNYHLTVADLAVFDALRANPAWSNNLKSGTAVSQTPHIVRWYSFIEASEPLQAALHSQAATSPQAAASSQAGSKAGGKAGAQDAAKKDQASYDIDLPGAVKGKVVTRFPPEPSGYLHIGHAKAAFLNEFYARHYDGKLIVRFDDTNPSKEKMEFEDSIMQDLATLGIKADQVSHTSDFFDRILELAYKLIKNGDAYVDDTPQEQMRKERMDGVASKNRNLSVEENLKRFEEMRNATEFGQKCCLRAKMSVDATNKALRDPVIYRCNLIPHPKTGTKYKLYPTYDFACPIVDSLEGVTHSLRTNEYHDRNDQFYWFIEKLGLRKPEIWDYSRMNFVYTLLSKRKLNWFVDTNKVSGWDDPRFPTIRGILRRGLTVEALKEYIQMQGPSRNVLLLEWDKLWAVNRKVLDPIAPRFTALVTQDRVKITIAGGPAKPYANEVPKHKKNPDVGNKLVTYASEVYIEAEDAAAIEDNEELTLMDWGNIIVTKINREGGKVTSIEAKLHLEGDFKKTKKKLTWLSDTENLINLELWDYDFLITAKKLEENDNFEDFLNPVTEMMTPAFGDRNSFASLKKGDHIQLERKGFYICDSPLSSEKGLRLIAIPDGKTKSLTGVSAKGAEGASSSSKPAAPAAKTPASSKPLTSAGGMYTIPPIYDFNVPFNAKEASSMYEIKPLYQEPTFH